MRNKENRKTRFIVSNFDTIQNFISQLKVNKEMTDFFRVYIFKNPDNLKEFKKYYLDLGNDGRVVFNEGLQNFSFYDRKENAEYMQFYFLLTQICQEMLKEMKI